MPEHIDAIAVKPKPKPTFQSGIVVYFCIKICKNTLFV